MESKDKSAMLMAFVLGAAAGAAIGYILASPKKDELIGDIKQTAAKVKDGIKSVLEKGQKLADDVAKETDDILGV